jgi:ArsR family transcriptional regulator
VAHDHEQLDLQEMQAAAARACALLKTLGNPDRLLLLCQLTQLVNTRREGKQIYYRLASKEASAVMQVLYEQFCTPNTGRQRWQLIGFTLRRGQRSPVGS